MRETKEITLRPYQQECTDIIEEKGEGKWLVAVATGLGKTVIMSHMKRHGRMLILSHRDELVRQPEKYFGCSFGIEKADEHADGEEIVSASVQSLSRDSRLARYAPDDFETVVVDEAHHASAPTYRKILNYFSGAKRRIGFTATPKRGDGVGLAGVFDEIIYVKDLRWGIENGYLSRIRALRVTSDYKLDKVKKTAGDYNQKQLEAVMAESQAAMTAAKTYVQECHNAGRHTIIYCVTRAMCRQVQDAIRAMLPEEEEDTVRVLTGLTETDERKGILELFSAGKVKCLVNPMVLTEGTDLPICDSIINMRPTCNPSLYQQMAGRGCRLYEGKEYNLLIDIAPEGETKSLCTAPTLFGIDPDGMTEKQASQVNPDNDLLELCAGISQTSLDLAKDLQLQIEAVDLFLTEHEALVEKNKTEGLQSLAKDVRALKEKKRKEADGYDFLGLAMEIQADESKYYKFKLSWSETAYISKPDILGSATVDFSLYLDPVGKRVPMRYVGTRRMEDAIRLVRGYCETRRQAYAYIWDTDTQRAWSEAGATEKQQNKAYYCYRAAGVSRKGSKLLNKLEASDLIDLSGEMKEKKEEKALLERARQAAPDPYDLSGRKSRAGRAGMLAKEKLERQKAEQEKAVESGKEGFAEFASRIEKEYGEILAYRQKLKEEQAKNADENGAYIPVPVNMGAYAPDRVPASSKQISYMESLLAAAKQRGDVFPPISTKALTKRQAGGMITILKFLLEDYPKAERTREYISVDKLLQDLDKPDGRRECRLYYN